MRFFLTPENVSLFQRILASISVSENMTDIVSGVWEFGYG
jgi:hypothetical protein